MFNEPVTDPRVLAAFDFTVTPPLDTTNKNRITLLNGASIGGLVTPLQPTGSQALLGSAAAVNASYFSQDIVDFGPYPPAPSDLPQAGGEYDPTSPEFKEALWNDLVSLLPNGADPAVTNEARQRFEEGFASALELLTTNDDLRKGFSHTEENGIVRIIAHGLKGDTLVWEGRADELDSCETWWIKFVYQLTLGFLNALGLGPSWQAVGSRVYNLVMQNAAVVAAMQSLIGRTVGVAAALGVLGVLYDQGLLWPILKLALTAAGYWALLKALAWAVAFITGAEAAASIASFIVWSVQLTSLSMDYQKSCPSALRAGQRPAHAG
jgi:hypothetical protein